MTKNNRNKNQSGIQNISIEGEKLLLIEDILGPQKARQIAEKHKGKAFGAISSILFQPKSEDIEIIYEEKRYQAFWHIVGTSSFEYKRRVRYQVPVETIVKDVTFQDTNYQVSTKESTFEIQGIEHCKESYREEIAVDAQTDQPGEYGKYIQAESKAITGTDELTKDQTPIVNIETKASFLVRKVLNALVKPIKADEIIDEKISIEKLCLYFYPVYTFEYLLKSKNKKVIVEFDGVTGECRKGRKISDRLRNSFSNDELFEFAKEVANFIPGGGLAVMAGRKAIEIAKKN